jgi:hypothetical protein
MLLLLHDADLPQADVKERLMHRGFVAAAWVSLAAAVVSAAFAVYVVVVGALVLTGRTGLPLHKSWGPFDVDSALTMPVGTSIEVCDRSAFLKAQPPGDCAAVNLHPDGPESERFKGDVTPVVGLVDLYGDLALRADPGWSPLVAARLAGAAVWAGLFSLLLFQLSRFLRAGAQGRAFGEVGRVRGIGLLVVAMSLLSPVIDQLTRTDAFGYGLEARGPGPMLQQTGDPSLNLTTVALGVVIVLVAEVLRRGAELEAEQELTV